MSRRLTLLMLAMLAVLGAARTSAVHAAAYPAGWNLVAGPAGTTFPGALAIYSFPSGASTYVARSVNGPAVTGAGYWAYYAQSSAPAFAGNPTACSIAIPAQAKEWFLAGNPSATNQARISGVSASLLYDPLAGSYTSNDVLQPGQGAWVMPDMGGVVTIDAGACVAGAGATGQSSSAAQGSAVPLTCAGFTTQAAAQTAFRSDPIGVAFLDSNRDGRACESLPCPCDNSPPATLPPPPGGPFVVAQGYPAPIAPSSSGILFPVFIGCYFPFVPGLPIGPSLGVPPFGGVCPPFFR